MLILGIDTCSMSSAAALVNEEKMIAHFVINHKKTHSERIMPQIEQMLAAAEVSADDIDAFAAAVGPGSFTGVRIGVATAKALASVKNKPCISVSSLEALALCALPFNGIISPVLDARRNQVYNAVFESDGRNLACIKEDRALPLTDLLEELKTYNKPVCFSGDGVPVFKETIISVLGNNAFFVPKPFVFNLASCVAEIGLKKFSENKTVSAEELIPSYVRLSQAEQELASRNG